MARELDRATLDGAARYYASIFLRPDGPRDGPTWVVEQLNAMHFADEVEYIKQGMSEYFGPKARAVFDEQAGKLRPRSEKELAEVLAKRLAVDLEGAHIPGKVGCVEVHGRRFVGIETVEVESPDSIRTRKRLGLDKSHRRVMLKEVPVYWPVYAGETEERLAGSDAVDPLPAGAVSMGVGATNTRISNECAILACDAVVDNLDEGTGAAVIQGRSGAQPADPDTAVTGTLLFTLVCSDPAFGGASDAAPGATATASAITDDSDADFTATLGYCRASSTNDGATPLDDHIDGEAGTSGADYNFNTLSIVSGATVSLTSWTVTMPES